MATTPTPTQPDPAPPAPARGARQRVPAAERRDALIDAAIHEFAHGGLYGTPVERVARRVGVAQPYVFSLFGGKRDLFLAAVERGFARVEETFTAAAEAYEAAEDPPEADVLEAMGMAYVDLLTTDRDVLMLQHQAYAACNDEVIRDAVRGCYANLVDHARRLSGADQEALDDFLRTGMWINVAAAMGVEDLSSGCEWIEAKRVLAAESAREADGAGAE